MFFSKKTTATLYKEDHLWGKCTYRCSKCGADFKNKETICPHCKAEFIKTKTEPEWIDEMAEWDDD